MFNKILIANRGEIALRIIKTLKKYNIKSVAIYSESDSQSLHVQQADEAYCVGPARVEQSYLQQDKIIQIAKQTGCEAIHPGYGLLSENPYFVKNCNEAGIVFIGPTAYVMEQAGDKVNARTLAKKAGIDPVPGCFEPVDIKEVKEVAHKIGYPILLKGVDGGGGIGMTVVEKDEDIEKNFIKTSRRAKVAFDSDRVYVEKYLPKIKHVEVQIFGDKFNNYIALGARECSIQRRYQKIVEESLSPAAVKLNILDSIQESALKIANQLNYTNAGTIEFLVTPEGKFYFLEVNARLQVEHPVTEMITGLDLVELQLIVASGDKLPVTQKEINFHGHAIEVRLYAENPEKGFIPAPGKIESVRLPELKNYQRIDHWLKDGMEVTPFYDPLLAKIICNGESRDKSRQNLIDLLQNIYIGPIKTNKDYLVNILKNPEFISGNYYVGLS